MNKENTMDTSDSEQMDEQQQSSFPDFQHLNIDLCLELICPYLGLNDLLRVADSCMQMRRAAQLTFAHKYRKQFFCLRDCEEGLSRYSNYEEISIEEKIILSKPKRGFRILRCFGQTISKLSLECSRSTGGFWTNLDIYIAKYCVNSLTELEMWNRRTSFENLQIPFPNVEKVRFVDCELNKTEFNKRFPQMRSLKFESAFTVTEVPDQSCIVEHFPNLEHLSVNVTNSFYNYGFQEETVLNALELNPKIRSLNLFSEWDHLGQEFIQKVSEICKSLEALQIIGYPLELSDAIHFKNVKYFKYSHRRDSSSLSYQLTVTPIPLMFDALESFDYNIPTTLSFILNYVGENPSIRKIKFSIYSTCLTHDRICEMENAFALFKEVEINLCMGTFSSLLAMNSFAEEISFLLSNFNSLKKLIFRAAGFYSFKSLLNLVKLIPQIPWTIDEKNEIIIYQKM